MHACGDVLYLVVVKPTAVGLKLCVGNYMCLLRRQLGVVVLVTRRVLPYCFRKKEGMTTGR